LHFGLVPAHETEQAGRVDDFEPIHVYIPGRADDPRREADLPDGVVAHYGPPLHPDDMTIVDGIPVTSVARTLIDLGEVVDQEELRDCFIRARERGLLDLDELAAARARVEWRPSLPMVDEIIAEFT
jgi:hypothetical protein